MFEILPPPDTARKIAKLSFNHALQTLSVLTLWLGVACLPLTCGCSPPLGPEAVQPAAAEPSDDQPLKISAELEALAGRLQAITAEVASSAERRAHGVHLAANYQSEEDLPQRVRAVCMNVSRLLNEPGRATEQLAEREAEPLSAAVMAQWQQAGALFGWSTMTQLQSLSLRHTTLKHEHLQVLGGLKQLKSLNLDGTRVTDASVNALLGFRNLKSLHLPGHATDASIRELQEALPAAMISANRGPL